ncbi:dUTP diphosphatase [Paracoccus sp. TOH]|uniref:dUTP diphosphatase n=1 Tax=Paracoccus sp. TOH TaxID=1263728 RepID=UPI0025B272DE|nr:dUTP diphosphatase [Paracoccus sp. TOH]WJS87203.1 dUTP diphosphatase [Paracoccus sp. TOH]
MKKPKIHFVKDHDLASLPSYETPEAAGADVRSVETVTIHPGARALVSTGLKCVVEEGWEIQVRPRSGLAFKQGVTVLNGPGTIDSDYAGILGVLLVNHGDAPFEVKAGDRIAQIVVAPVTQGEFGWADEIRETSRGAGGFGSTGVS